VNEQGFQNEIETRTKLILDVVKIGFVNKIIRPQEVYQAQINLHCTSTGREYPIRRLELSADSPLAQGVVWKWINDHGKFKPYCAEAVNYIEKHYSAAPKKRLNLSELNLDLNYTLDFKTLLQVKIVSCTIPWELYAQLFQFLVFTGQVLVIFDKENSLQQPLLAKLYRSRHQTE